MSWLTVRGRGIKGVGAWIIENDIKYNYVELHHWLEMKQRLINKITIKDRTRWSKGEILHCRRQSLIVMSIDGFEGDGGWRT